MTAKDYDERAPIDSSHGNLYRAEVPSNGESFEVLQRAAPLQ